MRNILFFVLMAVCIACNQSSENIDLKKFTPPVVVDSTDPGSLSFIKGWKNKYPEEVNMFDHPVIENRLSALLDAEYDLLKANWNVQIPFEEEQGIFHTGGCKKNDCPAFHSMIYFDIAANTINVWIMKDRSYKLYVEKDTIQLPEGMKKDLMITKGNL